MIFTSLQTDISIYLQKHETIYKLVITFQIDY